MDNPLNYTIYQEKWKPLTCEKLWDNLKINLKLYTYLFLDGLYFVSQFFVGL